MSHATLPTHIRRKANTTKKPPTEIVKLLGCASPQRMITTNLRLSYATLLLWGVDGVDDHSCEMQVQG